MMAESDNGTAGGSMVALAHATSGAAPRQGKRIARDYAFIQGAGGRTALGGISMGTGARDQNPETVTYEQLDAVRRDPVMRSALALIKFPILAATASVSVLCSDPAIQALVEYALTEHGLLRRIVWAMLKALDFGHAPLELVWGVEQVELAGDDPADPAAPPLWSGPAVLYRDVVGVNPASVREVLRDDQRIFAGFVQAPEILVELPYAAWYTADTEFGNIWGQARTREALAAFSWKQVIAKRLALWAEKKADPTRVIRHPVGVDDDTGRDYAEIAIAVANAIDGAVAVALPSSRDDTGEYRWTIQELQSTDRVAIFETALKLFEGQMFMAVIAPERAVRNPGQTGTYSEVASITDTFMLMEDDLLLDILKEIEDQIVAPLVLANFGPDAPRVRLTSGGVTDAQKAMLRDILTATLAAPEGMARVDLDTLAATYGVPLVEEEDEDDALGSEDLEADELATEGDEDGEGEGDNLILPPELALSDDGALMTLAAPDLSRYDISGTLTVPVIVDRTTGKRLGGFVAKSIFLAKAKAASAKPKAAPKGRKGPDAAKAAAAAQRKADADARREQRGAERATKAQERADAKAAREAAKEAKTAAAALTKAAKAERDDLAKTVANLTGDLAGQVLVNAGWQTEGQPTGDADAVRSAASADAARDPDMIVSVVQTRAGYLVIRKPKAALKASGSAGTANLLADDDDGGLGYDGGEPDADLERAWSAAEERIRAIYTSKADD